MTTIFGTRVVKIRKRCTCIGCDDIHEKGSIMVVTKGVVDGQFWNNYECPICHFFEKEPGYRYYDYYDQEDFYPPIYKDDEKYKKFREKFIETLQYQDKYQLKRKPQLV
jgi:hypothetical protein